jgi:uncharacterized RDD family membrane protein YckC
MLLEIFLTTPVNTKQKQDTHGMRLVDDRRDNRTRSDASLLVWIILYPSFILPCMLLKIFQTIPVNIKRKQDTHGMRLVDDRSDNRTRFDASVLE